MDCCGLLFNEALREIYRLRTGLDGCDTKRIVDRTCPALTAANEPRHIFASPPADRLPYAVRALGDVQPRQREQPPIIQPQPVTQIRVVTNLGTLLDVLI